MTKEQHMPTACTVLLLSVLIVGCSREPAVVDAAMRIEPAPDPNEVTIEHPERFPVVPVELRKMQNELSVTGQVAPDVSRNVPVIAFTSGRVVEVRARLGDDVKKGQILLTITSPDMSGAISDYQKFAAR